MDAVHFKEVIKRLLQVHVRVTGTRKLLQSSTEHPDCFQRTLKSAGLHFVQFLFWCLIQLLKWHLTATLTSWLCFQYVSVFSHDYKVLCILLQVISSDIP